MSASIFDNRNIEPDDRQLEEVLGEKYKYFQALEDYLI